MYDSMVLIVPREARNRQYDVYFFIIRTKKRKKLWNLFERAYAIHIHAE